MLQKKEEDKKETLEEERRRREKEAKEKELKVAVPEKKERVERIPLKKEEEHILIPLIKIQEVSMPELEKLELSKEISKIEKVRRTVSVPIIELQEPSLMLKEYELDHKIPRVEKTKKLLTIPIVRVKSPPRVSISLMEFDTEIRKPSQIILPKVRVPVYRKAILTSPKLLLESFDSTINEQLKERLERREEVERKLPGERVEAELIEFAPSLGAEEAPVVAAEENILDELFQPIKGGSFLKWEIHRPLCIVVIDNSKDGMKMIEDLMSIKYTFHGFYEFSRNLPWQRDIEQKTTVSESIEKGKEGIYEKIVSRELIVSDSVTTNDKGGVVKGLRDISNRGAKCVILYTKDIKDFENLELEVTGVDFKIIKLPELNSKTIELVGRLIGVDLGGIPVTSVDELWHEAIRLYEEEANELDSKLPHVQYFPERESEIHYLMKRLVYNCLKNKKEYRDKSIKVEGPLPTLDKDRREVIPDITVDNECWEVETGYPSKDESIMDPDKPFARLVLKLEKYPKQGFKICVVVPSIYAYMFREEIIQVKEYFRQVHKCKIKFYTLQWYKAGIKPFM